MKELIEHLQRIAKINNDSFKYHIDIFPYKNPKFEFVAEEDSDNHIFLSTEIKNLENVTISKEDLVDACNSWNYKYID